MGVLRSLKQHLKVYYHKWAKTEARVVKTTLLNRELVVAEGTIHKEDKDDAWFYALANNSREIFDIGCNIGSAAILATINDDNKSIVLVDPNPLALRIAANNLIGNSLSVPAHWR